MTHFHRSSSGSLVIGADPGTCFWGDVEDVSKYCQEVSKLMAVRKRSAATRTHVPCDFPLLPQPIKAGTRFIDRQKDKRLSLPSWLIYSGWFTTIVVTNHLLVERGTAEVESSLAKDQSSTTMLRKPSKRDISLAPKGLMSQCVVHKLGLTKKAVTFCDD